MKRCEVAIRVFDLVAATAGVLLLSPLLVVVAVAIRWDSAGPIIFCQERVGRNFRPFQIYKFRTMFDDAKHSDRKITVGRDARVTTVGSILRKSKIDEVPQLINVMKGEMSLVGPRPEVPKYVEMFRADFETILSTPPGITDLASIKFRNEADLLAKRDDPEWAYITQILPEKIRLAKQYVEHRSLLLNVKLLWRTLLAVLR